MYKVVICEDRRKAIETKILKREKVKTKEKCKFKITY